MSADEFWKDDPQLFVSYRTSFINKKNREIEELDYKCWRQGLYVYDGMGKLILSLRQFINNIFAKMFKGKLDNTKIDSYPQKPYIELEKEEKEQKQKMKQLNNDKILMVQGSIKQIYMERLKNKNK